MARIRTTKPEFWSSPDTAACEDPWARLLFLAMWNWADDDGRGTANPKELAGFAFPNDDHIDPAAVRRMLGGIRRAFGVVFYVVGGRPYYEIPSWSKHQKIDNRSKGRHPAPANGELWNPDPNDLSDQHERQLSLVPAESSGGSPETSPKVGRDLGAGTGEQGNRGTTPLADQSADRDPNPTPPPAAEPDPFDRFWQTYPKRVKKQDALKAWRQALRRPGVTADKVTAAAEAANRHWQRHGTEPQYIPYPASWLRAGGYDDDLDQAARPAAARVVPTFDDLRRRGDAPSAAALIGATYIERPQPPSDRSDPYAWEHDRGVEWIDQHADQIHAALTARRTG